MWKASSVIVEAFYVDMIERIPRDHDRRAQTIPSCGRDAAATAAANRLPRSVAIASVLAQVRNGQAGNQAIVEASGTCTISLPLPSTTAMKLPSRIMPGFAVPMRWAMKLA